MQLIESRVFLGKGSSSESQIVAKPLLQITGFAHFLFDPLDYLGKGSAKPVLPYVAMLVFVLSSLGVLVIFLGQLEPLPSPFFSSRFQNSSQRFSDPPFGKLTFHCLGG